MITAAHKTEGVNRTKAMRIYPFVFTGKERDPETGYSYFGARYYDSDLSGLFLSVDPMSDKYPSISPYAYCAWNPVKLVDPDGEDIWEINQQGKIVNHIKSNDRDAFYIVDDKGNRMLDENNMVKYKSISFEYGSFSELPTNNRLLNQTGFKANNNSDGMDLFKFLADNTSVEYGLITTKGSGSFLLTCHDASNVNATKYAKFLDSKGFSIFSIIHNHPEGSPPSGFGSNDTHGDKFSAQNLVSSHGNIINFFVYTGNDQKLTMYDGNAIYKKDYCFSFKQFIMK